MLGRIDLKSGFSRKRALTTVKVVFAATMLASCSSIPDSVNPTNWFGGDEPAIATPVGKSGETAKPSADSRKDLARGLPADRDNSKYAEPVRREVSPTKQLARRNTQTQVAALPEGAVPPKPEVAAQDLPAQMARDDGPNAPPGSVNMTPPSPADVPETVPLRGRRLLQDQFQRRLAESAAQTVTPGLVAMPASYGASGAYGLREEEPIHLVPPSSRRGHKGGGKGLAAPAPVPEPSASFQVASLDFRAGSSDLTGADRSTIAEIARLYRQTGGVVRVVGFAPPPVFGGDAVAQVMGGLDASMKRANAVARELTRRGVPAGKIMVGGEPSTAVTEVGAQVYIDVI